VSGTVRGEELNQTTVVEALDLEHRSSGNDLAPVFLLDATAQRCDCSDGASQRRHYRLLDPGHRNARSFLGTGQSIRHSSFDEFALMSSRFVTIEAVDQRIAPWRTSGAVRV
jgi:hypothetical protein